MDDRRITPGHRRWALPVVGTFGQTMFCDPVLADKSEVRRLLPSAANPLREDAGDGNADQDPDPAYRHGSHLALYPAISM